MSQFALSSVPVRFRPVMEAVAEAVFTIFDEQIEAFYTVGSAPRGDFIDGSSDIDFRCILSEDASDDQVELWIAQKKLLASKFDYDVELMLLPKARLDNLGVLQFVIVRDGVLIFGRPYQPTMMFPPRGFKLAQFLSQNMPRQLAEASAAIDSPDINPGDYARISRWIAKVGIRLGANLAIAKGEAFRASIHEQTDFAIHKVPALAEPIRALFEIYLHPSDTKAQLSAAVADVAKVVAEAKSSHVLED
ncbi:hypothetical protein HJC99_04245 [Candidatus Saccharibacteria bacterium]|nr:hypothetical protein [Candidatus Saccharibacteria bacterium]